jgi:hypothetical protein
MSLATISSSDPRAPLSGALIRRGRAGGTEDRLEIAEAVLAGAWRTLRAAGFHEAEVQALFDQIADRPEDLARRLRKMANAGRDGPA